MKQLAFNFIKIRLRILGINISNTFKTETAYPAENWANILSTFFYTASYIVFLNIIFSNVRALAGYSRNDMLFFAFIGQLSFYTLFNWSYDNMENLIQSIRLGELDILLTKPLPTLFFVSTRQFSIIKLIRDAFVPMTMIGLLINWSGLNLSLIRIFAGLVIFICGQWSLHTLQLLLIMPVFKNGQSEALLRLSYTLGSNDLPFEGLSPGWRLFLTTVLPILLPVSASVSVMTGRGDALTLTALSIIMALVATVIRRFAWIRGLQSYNSASS